MQHREDHLWSVFKLFEEIGLTNSAARWRLHMLSTYGFIDNEDPSKAALDAE